jgi:hypothetical protein
VSRWEIPAWMGVGVLVTLVVVLLVEFGGQGPVAPTSAQPTRPAVVDDMWPLGVKADRLEAMVRYQPTEPTSPSNPVNNEDIQNSPTPAVVEPIQSVRISKRRRDYAYDICRGRGRYYINGGKSWRCNRR